MYEPRDNGALIYLNANPDMQPIVDRIESAGGTVQIPKTQISPEVGYMCVFIDSEGNRMALHSQN
jgi:predicted enzyme related to lactoylglutathione lyase